MNEKSVSLFGSCRVYRPFLKQYKSIVYNNVFPGVDVHFPKVGFFHSIKEITQCLRFIKSGITEAELLYSHYLFRKEPEHTTPSNIFNTGVWDAEDYSLLINNEMSSIDFLVLEISSLDYFYHADSGLCFHWNPNRHNNASYGSIYPDGYYNKFEKQLGVEKKVCGDSDILSSISEIKEMYPDTEIIITGHINDKGPRSKTRHELNKVLQRCCAGMQHVHYFDNNAVFEKYGYAINQEGIVDIHHLSHQGELVLGNELQSFILGLSK
jgi:hypothetical protein